MEHGSMETLVVIWVITPPTLPRTGNFNVKTVLQGHTIGGKPYIGKAIT